MDAATHRETWPLRSTGFRRWLTHRFFTEEAKAPGSQAVIDVVRTLEASAVVDGAEQPTYIRVAEHEGAIWVDLCNERWEAVQITREGWSVVPSTAVPVRFLRYKGMTALPHPVGGGDLTELRPFVNVQDDGDFSLVVGFLLCALRQYANMKYPVLCFVGEQGSAKSVMTRVVKKLLDPSTSDLRSEQKEARDLMIYATHSWCLALDNVSHLPDWLSDALCRLATGGGFSTRTLYEDDEEMIFEATRPVVLNGITDIATRADLLDRTLLVRVPAIPETLRRGEAEFWKDFDAAHPRILGGLFDAAAAGLREFPTTKLDKTPRMADAATWVVAAESALPWAPGTFLVAYQQSSATATAVVLDSELIVPVLLRVISKAAFEGTASELLIALNEEASDAIRRDRYWPKDATRLSGKLRRIAPSLRAEGIAIEFDDGRGTRRTQRTIRIPKVESTAPHNDPNREGGILTVGTLRGHWDPSRGHCVFTRGDSRDTGDTPNPPSFRGDAGRVKKGKREQKKRDIEIKGFVVSPVSPVSRVGPPRGDPWPCGLSPRKDAAAALKEGGARARIPERRLCLAYCRAAVDLCNGSREAEQGTLRTLTERDR
ncbi:MAG: ATP-binding protein [Actinobacteria bacterium]|nr:ATP-binding protein [Actinomycetota bacterium]